MVIRTVVSVRALVATVQDRRNTGDTLMPRTRPTYELAFPTPDGRYIRLVDDDGLDQAEWIIVDSEMPGRSTTVSAEQALELVADDHKEALAWSALMCRIVSGDTSPAGLGSRTGAISDPDREAIVWWSQRTGTPTA